MSHVVVIIQRSAAPAPNGNEAGSTPTYEYRMPIPHEASPADVAQMVREAYKRLEKKED